MIRCAGYTISFQEVPDEISLVLLISGCPYRCKGCHSPELQRNIGDEITKEYLDRILAKYADSITCVCFMGEGGRFDDVFKWAHYLKTTYGCKTALYTGMSWDEFKGNLMSGVILNFDYLKYGPYDEKRGGLSQISTNQRFLKLQIMENGSREWCDLTYRFRPKPKLPIKRYGIEEDTDLRF